MPLRGVIAVLLLAACAGAKAEDGARLDILEFEIDGNTVLAVDAVERAVLPFLGENRAFADIEAARAALEKAYQDAGYLTVYVDVPEQRVDAGLVRLRVTEGRVERLRVTGAAYTDPAVLRERVDQLAPGRVPDFNAMQRQLAAAGRDERRIQPLLRPGLAPGTVEAELRVSDRLPLAASVEFSNRHAADTSALRAQASLRYENLFQRDHAVSLSVATAPLAVSQSRLLSLGWTAPLADGETTFAASLVASDSAVEPLGAVTVLGRGTTLGLRWLRTRALGDTLHTASVGIDLKDLRERVVAGGSELSTPLRYAPFAIGYQGSWFDRDAPGSLSATLTAAWPRLLAREVECPGTIGRVDQFACKREGADGGFATLRADWRQAWGRWNLRLAGLAAMQPLPSAEQFAIGGAESVRGYLEAEASGDQGLLASVEWRSPNLASRLEPGELPLASLVVAAFADAGRARTLQPGTGQASRVPLAGAGFGLRLRAQRLLEAELDLAWPLRDTRASRRGDPRLHARVAARF